MADDTETTPPAKPATRRRTPRTTSADKAAGAASKTPAPRKPRVAKPAAEAGETPRAKRAAATPKPRAAKRATPAPKRRTAKSTVETATDKVVGKWGAAAVVGGVVAVGAVGAALLTLRGSTPRDEKPAGTEGDDGATPPVGDPKDPASI